VYRHKNSHIDLLKHVLIDCWSYLSQITVTRVIDLSPKRLMIIIKVNDAHAEFCLDIFVQMIVTVTFAACSSWKLVKSMHFCQIQHIFTCGEYLCKVGNKYLNALTYKFCTFSRRNSEYFDISHVFLPLLVAKLSTVKNSPVFGPENWSPHKVNVLHVLTYTH